MILIIIINLNEWARIVKGKFLIIIQSLKLKLGSLFEGAL